MSTCPNCRTDNPAGGKFCLECGNPLARTCPVCGGALADVAKFCGQCGAPVLGEIKPSAAATSSPSTPHPASERRLVSILFADLVGFTTLSESRDPEEVRELLTRYFDSCSRIVALYGGVVEKFIGDAVMAIWGAPTAQEDDAERAVRAALDLTDAVAALGDELGAPELQARAGVLTGESSVALDAGGQGMVVGDSVNTASRIQSAATPGSVLVGEATRRAAEAAIAFEDAGTFELKGKSQRVRLWRALRVVAGRGGAMKSERLEAPFVGRDRELRLVKDLFHASAGEGKAHLVSIVGFAGIGKSRLAWEFFKYIDGLKELYRWHRGRCLAYGEGVTYWALAEMVRARAEIVESEEASSAAAKLRAALELHITDPDERRWIEPRLAHLIGLEERAAWEKEDLFAGWRLLFERMAQERPVILAFEDMQWADAALLDFIEYLMEWSRNHPIFVLTMARPELLDRLPTWGAGKRNFTSLALEPLSPQAMQDLLAGLVPGLPDDLREKILDRAEGVPLYAVETVRMLLDRALLVRQGASYRPAGPIEALEVPETLHALIAARLDGVSPKERRLLQTASVLGKSFTAAGLGAVSGFPQGELEPMLASLVRKEILGIQADPRSPERGQYGFLQDLVKRIAYETLSRRDRKAKHLAVAEHLEVDRKAEEEEIVEVVASHYLDAYEALPDDPDAGLIKRKAALLLARAGERAASLAATVQAETYFQRALELCDEPREQARLAERAGEMARAAGRLDVAQEKFHQAIELFEAEGETHAAARVSARLAEVLWDVGSIEVGLERMERSFRVLSEDEPDADLAMLASQLGRLHFFHGDLQQAADRIDIGLEMAERLFLPEVLSHSLNTKSLILDASGRHEEARALLLHALNVALEHDVSSAVYRAYYNLFNEPVAEALAYAERGLALARRVGNRMWEFNFLGRIAQVHWLDGNWDEAVSVAAPLVDPGNAEASSFGLSRSLTALVHLHLNRGDLEEAERILSLREGAWASGGIVERADYRTGLLMLSRAKRDLATVRESSDELVEFIRHMGNWHETSRVASDEVLEAALEAGDLERAEELLTAFQVESSPRYHMHLVRFQPRLAALRGDTARAEAGFKGSVGVLRESETPFFLAAALVEYAEWLQGAGRVQEMGPLLQEAGTIFERLRARPWIERVQRMTSGRGVATPVGTGGDPQVVG
jgi:class 3 adenylate cyclase/tetratricopeptide (TPR) repeat protein